jgi:integrase
MAIHRLGPTALKRKTPGMYCDGGGLWLQVSIARDGRGRNRSWIFRYSIPDASRRGGYRTREMGLGSVDTVSLERAREKARQCRELRDQNLDPIAERDKNRAARAAATARVMTFDQCLNAYLGAHRKKWRSQKHAAEWAVSLAKWASPVFGRLPVQEVDTALVVKALEKIWHDKPETASRLRGRIEAILDWATVRGFRRGDNPARWTGYLEKLLPSRRELLPVTHFQAMPYRDVPALVASLRAQQGSVPRALEFLILTASRAGEVLGAQWDEINFTEKVWSIPAARMKSGRAHRVPLSARCLEILAEMEAIQQNDFIFAGSRNEAISPHPMRRLLNRLIGKGATIHGMRSAFRDWAAECTNFPREIPEVALAHSVGDETEKAYQRGDLLQKRRQLMVAWERYCAKPLPAGATVTPIHKVGAKVVAHA